MAVCRHCCRMLFCLWLAAFMFAQATPPPTREPSAHVARVPLDEASSFPIPSLPAESIGAPLLCDSDSRIVFRLASPEKGLEDPVSVSGDGKTVIHLGSEKITDVPRPVFLSISVLGSEVFVLIRGSVPLGSETKWRAPTGEVVSQQASKGATYIARFAPGGNYAGAVRLDLPFKPMRFGVFENGDFLLAGADPSTDEPRVAILASNGQFRRFLDLKGDVHAEEVSGAPENDKDPTALPRLKPADNSPESFMTQTLRGVLSGSQIVKDGRNLLFFRPLNGPVFSISPSGQVTVHQLKIPGDFHLYTIKPTERFWIVEFLHQSAHGAAQEFSTYAFDPVTGDPLREYFFPADLGWGLACTDGSQFTFVLANEKTNSLQLVTLAPTAEPN